MRNFDYKDTISCIQIRHGSVTQTMARLRQTRSSAAAAPSSHLTPSPTRSNQLTRDNVLGDKGSKDNGISGGSTTSAGGNVCLDVEMEQLLSRLKKAIETAGRSRKTIVDS